MPAGELDSCAGERAISSDVLHGARPHAVWPSAAMSYHASTRGGPDAVANPKSAPC
jgi:hypothetical protein